MALVCDLCGGSDILKQDGVFVCQTCGTKYTIEEARKMMGASSPVPAVTQSNQHESLLTLARSSFDSKNYKQAEEFCNQVIALDAKNYEAWKLKGEAINYQINAKNPRILEVYNCIMTAFRVLDDAQKREKGADVLSSLKTCLEGEIKYWLDQFEADRPTQASLQKVISTYEDCYRKLADAFTELGFEDSKAGYLINFDNYFIYTANGTTVSAWKTTVGYNYFRDDFNNLGSYWNRNPNRNESGTDYYRPSEETRTTFVEETGHLVSLLEYCVKRFNDETPVDTIKNVYSNLVYYTETPSNQCSYKPMVTTWTNGYGAVTSRSEYYEIDRFLTDSAKKFRREAAAKYKADEKAAIAKITAKQAEKRRQEQAARNKQYWDAHTEERAALEAQKKELEAQLSPITEELAALDSKLQEFKKKYEVKVPARLDLEALQSRIKALEQERSSLGLFKGKEKKALQEQIQALQTQLPALKHAVSEQEQIQKQDFAKETAPISTAIRESSNKKQQIKSEIDKINTELTKDR